LSLHPSSFLRAKIVLQTVIQQLGRSAGIDYASQLPFLMFMTSPNFRLLHCALLELIIVV
jgi:hypothetical protein